MENQKLTQDKVFDFMSKMSKAMRDENIPIVNNVVYDFYKVDQEEKEEEKTKPQAEWEILDE